ncbi:MAG: FtsQ-type POTRA domain-containing protein [Actinobacteria bacterium]|nr:FtsQ-type POTRA domain-containing protein [Actinomycetota bacterium]
MLVFLTLFSLAGGAWLLAQSSLLDVEQVRVVGAQHTSAADVRRAVAVRIGEPLLLVDRGAAARRVERLPWVDDADASFSLPATLVVTVTERTPVAWVSRAGEEIALVDANGRVLDVRFLPPEGLMEIDAPDGARVPNPGETATGFRGPLRIAAAAPEGLARRVRGVRPARGGWVLELDTVALVRFGEADEVDRKWAALEAVVERLGEREVYLIDVRVPSVPAVREEKSLPTTTTVPPASSSSTSSTSSPPPP